MRWFLLPGLDGTGRLFAPLCGILPPQTRSTIVSYRADYAQSYDELCNQVAEQLPLDAPYLLVAESFSGPIAIRLAARKPPNLRAVIFCASFARFPGGTARRMALSCLSHFVFSVTMPHWAVRRFLAGDDAPERLLSLFSESVATVSPVVLGHRVRMALAVDDRETLGETTVPLLYLLATRDRLLGPSSATQMQHFRRDMSVVPIEAPHFVLQRKPDEAIQAIDGWIQKLSWP